jgi:hypothetical protein
MSLARPVGVRAIMPSVIPGLQNTALICPVIGISILLLLLLLDQNTVVMQASLVSRWVKLILRCVFSNTKHRRAVLGKQRTDDCLTAQLPRRAFDSRAILAPNFRLNPFQFRQALPPRLRDYVRGGGTSASGKHPFLSLPISPRWISHCTFRIYLWSPDEYCK